MVRTVTNNERVLYSKSAWFKVSIRIDNYFLPYGRAARMFFCRHILHDGPRLSILHDDQVCYCVSMDIHLAGR